MKIKAPSIESFEAPASLEKKYGGKKGDTVIMIRPATFRENQMRASRFFGKFRRRVDPSGEMVVEGDVDLTEVMAYELYLTLAGVKGMVYIDEDGEEKPLFKFKGQRLAMSEDEFYNALGLLPDDVVQWMHECVLKVNPQWGPEGENS